MWGQYFNWKLNTKEDWLYFLSLVLATGVTLAAIYFVYSLRRREGVAKRAVARRMKRHGPKGTKVYTNIRLSYGGREATLDHLAVGSFGLILVRTFHRGLSVYGEDRSETWKIQERGKSDVVPNPVIALEEGPGALLYDLLAKESFYGVNITPLAVFADNFEMPNLYLGHTSNALIFNDLKGYMQNKRVEKPNVSDVQKLQTLLERFITQQEKP